MKRPYKDGEHNDVVYYTGVNVERTLAYGMKTLFLNEMRPAKMVIDIAKDRECEHIYIGANKTFKPTLKKHWDEYELLVSDLTTAGFLVTVEHDLTQAKDFLDGGFVENNMVIPVLSVCIPYIEQYRNNACLKISDQGFDSTNPGVWVHSYNDMTKTEAFTHWRDYKEDLPV
jgi:hypothetical protein